MNQAKKIASLGPKSKKFLRELNAPALGLNVSASIQRITKELGADSITEAYETMRQAWNEHAANLAQERHAAARGPRNAQRRAVAAAKRTATIQKARADAISKLAKVRARIREAIPETVINIRNVYDSERLAAIYHYFKSKKGNTVHLVGYRLPSDDIGTIDERVSLPNRNSRKHLSQAQNIFEDVPVKGFCSWWKKLSWIFWEDSAHLWPRRYVFTLEERIPDRVIVQNFAEGITNCLLTPIQHWAEDALTNAKSAPAKSRYSVILKKLLAYAEKYTTGVPETDLSEICNDLQIDIVIESPFNPDPLFEVQSTRKRLRRFKFLNSRIDHVDFNELTICATPIESTLEEITALKAKLDESKTFYTYRLNNGKVSSISTLTNTYSLNCHFSEVVAEFEKSTGLIDCKIDDFDENLLSVFIGSGTNYNGTVDFDDVENVRPEINHIDMKKAYANFKTCAQYCGFLGKITDFRQTDKIQGVGMYRITDLDLTGCSERFQTYNKKMKIYFTNNVYCSPELEMLRSRGATFKIVSGCWGVKPLDFEFSADMLESKNNGTSYYARWTGLVDSHQRNRNIFMPCTKEFFGVVSANCKFSKFFGGTAMVSYEKTHNYHLGHVVAFITAYQRLNVIEQLLEIDPVNVLRVCVDGIYYYGECELKNVFRVKEDRNFANLAASSYVSRARVRNLIKRVFEDGWKVFEKREKNAARESYGTELHLGAGGCGKTHFNCTDRGLVRPLFIAPSWKLAISKKKELDMNVSVWARALSDDPEKISAIRRFNVLIIDEVSMLSDHQKLQFFSQYGDMKIIMCGDLGFQLPCITGDEMEPTGFANIVRHETDHRCKDPLLRQLKDGLRMMIANGFPRAQINEWTVEQFKTFDQVITPTEMAARYCVSDMILAGTNSVKDAYTKLCSTAGQKWYITENNRLHQNGEIVIGEKPEMCKSELRHCFTAHSIQGETAEAKLFIDAATMFDSRMFYTAVSRARKLEQIYIVV